jgi:hypothetical protein
MTVRSMSCVSESCEGRVSITAGAGRRSVCRCDTCQRWYLRAGDQVALVPWAHHPCVASSPRRLTTLAVGLAVQSALGSRDSRT